MALPAGNEFDFQTGNWKVRHTRLLNRLTDEDTSYNVWQEFDGTSSAYPILDGRGNIEDNFLDLPGDPYRAVAIRSYDIGLGQWSIWWLDGRNPHCLDTPVIGCFVNGVGLFYADDQFAGKPIKVRFEWSRLESDTPRWQQAFSPDGGSTWEINWTMDFSRI